MKSTFVQLTAFSLLIALGTACAANAGASDSVSGDSSETGWNEEGKADSLTSKVTCAVGTPVETVDHGATRSVKHTGYVLLHSSTDKVPLYVCENLKKTQLNGDSERSNKFFPEPSLPKGERAELADYVGSGFDRGHMAPAGDWSANQTLMNQSFSLANMAPQVPALNRGIWVQLESQVRTWATARGEVDVITGPIFDAGSQRIGPDNVVVPDRFFKIAVSNGSNGREAIGFIFENRAYPQPYTLSDQLASIDAIEQATGFDFMPDLSTDDEAALERAPAQMWPSN